MATLAPALVGVSLGVVTAPAAHAAPGCTTDTALVTTCSFAYTGSSQAWTAPPGVVQATFTVVGAAGGWAGNRPGGPGGGVVSTMAVSPGETLRLFVGGKGGSDTDAPAAQGLGGWNGGGNGAGSLNPGGAGGGGASDVRRAPYDTGDRVIVGGGGGGTGSPITYGNAPHGIPGAGGAGGGTGDGGPGQNVSGAWVGAGGGGGGSATAAGGGGGPSNPVDYLYNGCGFWNPAYPSPGIGGSSNIGGAGGYLFSSLNGQRCDQFRGWGGGGGGGWYAGGGGGGGITAGAGGGGGSGHGPQGSVATPPGQRGAHGQITISYTAWQSMGGGLMSSAPTVAPYRMPGDPREIHDVFYLNEHGSAMTRTVIDGVIGPETPLDGVFYPGSTIAAVWRFPDHRGRLDLFARGTESALWQKSFDGFRWGAWTALTGPGKLTSDPTVTAMDAASLDVFYRGTHRELQHLPIRDGKPQFPESLDGALITGPAAVTGTTGKLDVYTGETAPALDNFFVERIWKDGGSSWSTTTNLPDGRKMTSTPSVSSAGGWAKGVAIRTELSAGVSFIKSTWGNDWQQFWTDIPAPAPAGSAPAIVAKPDGATYTVYLRGNDNRLIARTFS